MNWEDDAGDVLGAFDPTQLRETDCPEGCPCPCHGDEEDITAEHVPGCLWDDPDFPDNIDDGADA